MSAAVSVRLVQMPARAPHEAGASSRPQIRPVLNEPAARFRHDLDASDCAASVGSAAWQARVEAVAFAACCDVCLYYWRGQCRARSPLPTRQAGAVVAVWPAVEAGEWCGEFRDK